MCVHASIDCTGGGWHHQTAAGGGEQVGLRRTWANFIRNSRVYLITSPGGFFLRSSGALVERACREGTAHWDGHHQGGCRAGVGQAPPRCTPRTLIFSPTPAPFAKPAKGLADEPAPGLNERGRRLMVSASIVAMMLRELMGAGSPRTAFWVTRTACGCCSAAAALDASPPFE